jgi:hypothetical protein
MSEIETFCVGSPLDFAIRGVSQLSSRDRRSHNNLAKPITEQYGTSVSEDTADVIKRLYSSVDGVELVRAVKNLGLDEVEDYDALLSEFDLDEDEDANLGRVMQEMDQKLHHGLAPRDKDADKVSTKKHRNSTYIPELVNSVGEGGTVYMAKTLSTTAKVLMAWDLHDENQVVVVDDYKWGSLLGWEKLKQFPHGKNKIREEYGDRLSDEVLNSVAGSEAGDSDTKSDSSSSGSRGRRTRTKPTDEVLNVALSSAHSSRFKEKAEDIKETFEDDATIGSSYKPVDMLVLFPSTTDLNMSNHYWVAGSRAYDDAGRVGIANCNKGTFEYLNDCEQVWHIEDYLAQASDYEFDTNYGPVTLGTIDRSNLVLHVVSPKTKTRLMRSVVLDTMPEVLPDYCDDEIYTPPEDFPHADDMMYAPITPEDVFWLRPELREITADGENGILLYATSSPRDVGKKHNLSSDYKLYARARLPDWDFEESTELETLDGASYNVKMDKGGYEIVETLAKLHDAGEQPFSVTPESRWDNA